MSNARRKMARETQALMERALAATCPSTGKPYTLEDTRPLPPKAVKRAMQEAFQSNSSQTALFNRLAYAGADGSAETWQNALVTLGVPLETATEIRGRYARLQVRERQTRSQATLNANRLAEENRHRLQAGILEQLSAWDAPSPGSSQYRFPNNSLTDGYQDTEDLLGQALELVLLHQEDGDGLGPDELGYCVFSACKHGRQYERWIEKADDVPQVAEALLDMLAHRAWVRTGLRAAWCLQKMTPQLRDAAVELGLTKLFAYAADSEGPNSFLPRLLGAVGTKTVEQETKLMIEEGVLSGTAGQQAQDFLDELLVSKPILGARGQLSRP